MQTDDPTDIQPPSSDENDDELFRALGAEIHAYIAEQNAILLAQIDARMAGQSEILNSIKELQMAWTSVMLAPRMLIQDEAGRPIGVKTLLS